MHPQDHRTAINTEGVMDDFESIPQFGTSITISQPNRRCQRLQSEHQHIAISSIIDNNSSSFQKADCQASADSKRLHTE